jgi:CheY-like chemotaxis protein
MSWVVSLIEDDDDIREHLAAVLKARGLQVVEARNGADALDLVRTRGIRPALIIADLMMPVMDGWAFLGAQASEPLIDGVPVVVITARDPVGPLPATVQAVFQKPFALSALLDTIRHLCADLEPPKRPLARGSTGLAQPLSRDGSDRGHDGEP